MSVIGSQCWSEWKKKNKIVAQLRLLLGHKQLSEATLPILVQKQDTCGRGQVTPSMMCQFNTGSNDQEFREVDLEVEYQRRVPTQVGKPT